MTENNLYTSIGPKNDVPLSNAIKNIVASKQSFKCANKPDIKLKGLEDYDCILWKTSDGSFDGSGFTIDHIIERCLGGSHDLNNLQALCSMCHMVKTKYFACGIDNGAILKKPLMKAIDAKNVSTSTECKYNCLTCDYSTDTYCNYQKHLQTKNHKEKTCIPPVSNIKDNIIKKLENQLSREEELIHKAIFYQNIASSYQDELLKIKDEIIAAAAINAKKKDDAIILLSHENKNLWALLTL